MPVLYKYKSFLVEINDNNSLRSYEEKELSSCQLEKITELVKLLYPYEVISKNYQVHSIQHFLKHGLRLILLNFSISDLSCIVWVKISLI